jgi:hypothetical protein
MQRTELAPHLTFRSFLDRTFQKSAEAWVATTLPQRAAIVRTYNEALWRSFGTSYMASRSLVRGRHGTLYEEGYILVYCGISTPTKPEALPPFAQRLRSVQDWFQARGQRFIFVSAPAKTTWFANRIPTAFPCPENQRDWLHVPAFAALNHAGVHYVDERAALEAARHRVAIDLFPINGIHWNWLGAAIGAEAIIQALRDAGLSSLPALSYDLTVDANEVGPDRDLSDLLNLLIPPPGDPAPRVIVKPVESLGALRIVSVNDSFFTMPAYLLTAAGVFQSATLFGYMTLDQRRFVAPNIVGFGQPISADEQEIVRAILTADVVVLEEVETHFGSPYALRFLDLIEREMAHKPSSTAQAR